MKIGIQTVGRLTIICLIILSASTAGHSQSPISEEKKKRLGNFDPVDIFSPAGNETGKVREKRTPLSEPFPTQGTVRRITVARKNPASLATGITETSKTIVNPPPAASATPLTTARSEIQTSVSPPSPTPYIIAASASPTPVAALETQPLLARADLDSSSAGFSASRGREQMTYELRKYTFPITLALLLVASVTLVLMVLKLLKLRSQDG